MVLLRSSPLKAAPSETSISLPAGILVSMTPTAILWCTAAVNVVAIIAAPITALWVQRKGDDNRALKARREAIFRALWTNRAPPAYIARVDALNMIDVEFFGEPKIIDAWADLLAHYKTDYRGGQISGAEQNRQHVEKYATLLYEISQKLGYHLGKTHIRDDIYRPNIHNEVDEIDLQTRRLKRDLLKDLVTLDALPVRFVPPQQDTTVPSSHANPALPPPDEGGSHEI